MLELNKKLAPGEQFDGVLSLPFHIRQKSRFRAALTDGTPVAVIVERGSVLRHGDRLVSNCERIVAIEAQPERVSDASHDDPQLLARAAYHLGNRHVPVQVLERTLRYLHDHVLDGMCEQLGLHIATREARFEPEVGAYHAHTSHSHSHA